MLGHEVIEEQARFQIADVLVELVGEVAPDRRDRSRARQWSDLDRGFVTHTGRRFGEPTLSVISSRPHLLPIVNPQRS
jgi:hypothetical protein